MRRREKSGRCCHGLIEFFLTFDAADPKDVDETGHQRAKLALRAFFLYVFYVSNVLIVAILSQSQNNYLLVHALEYHLIHAQFSSKATWMETNAQLNPSGNINVKYRQASRIHFRQIATFADIWQYMQGVIGEVFYPSHQSRTNQTQSPGITWILDHYLLIGVIRLRQVRVKAEACQIPASYADEIDECYPDYSSDTRDTEPFGQNNAEIHLQQAWHYTPANLTGMGSLTGQYGTYDGSGYVADLAEYVRSQERFFNDWKELERHQWLDKASRALFIDIITFNPSVNLFSNIQLRFEMPSTGGIFPSYTIDNRQLLRTLDSIEYVRLSCELIILLFTLFFLVIEIVKLIQLRLRIFLYLWNWIGLLHLIISISMFVVRVYHQLTVRSRLNDPVFLTIDTFDLLSVKLFRLQALLDGLSVLLTSTSIIRLLKYCDFAANLVRIKATIQRCFGDLVGFLVMFVAIMIAFAQFGNLALGQRAPAFSTLGKAFVALFRTVLSDFDYDAISDASPITGPLFLFLYIFSMVFMLFNMVLAIIVDSYEELGSEHRGVINRMLIDVMPLITDSIRIFFQRLGLWTKVKFVVQLIISAEDPSTTKSVAELLQAIKYSGASSLYDELHRAFAHDLTKLITNKDFDTFLNYTREDRARQRETLESLFTDHRSTEKLGERGKTMNFCTIQQWAQLRYRLARLEELVQLLQAKMKSTIRTSETLLQTGRVSE